MKNAYINSVFISRLYLHTIQKKQNKNILLIKQIKYKKIKSLHILNHNTYLLICWRWKYNHK
jgi:hypothetical protein